MVRFVTMMNIYLLLVTAVAIPQCLGISITSHSQPQHTHPEDVKQRTGLSNYTPKNDSHTTSDRQKRLSPYVTFYTNLNNTNMGQDSSKGVNYQLNEPRENSHQLNFQNEKEFNRENDFTLFHQSDALPGRFSPIIRNQAKPIRVHFFNLQNSQPSQDLGPDFSSIYGKLWELKSKQQFIKKETNNNFPLEQAPPRQHSSQYLNRFKNNPTKTVIQTYSPTNIDIPSLSRFIKKPNHEDSNFISHKISPIKFENIEPFSTNHVLLDLPQNTLSVKLKEREGQYRRPIVVFQRPHVSNQEESSVQRQKPVLFVQTRPSQNYKVNPSPIIEENYVAQKYVVVPKYPVKVSNPTAQQHFTPDTYKYEPNYSYQPITPTPIATSSEDEFTPARDYYKYETNFVIHPVTASTFVTSTDNNESNRLTDESSNSLSLILKKLQDANAVPHTLTVENIDNSIKTLVKILNSLKKSQTLSKPIVVASIGEEYNSEENSSEEYSTENPPVNLPSEAVLPIPETIDNTYPEDTQEGGTPGTAGIDYPALSSIPPTTFDCKTQRYKGFFGDPDTNCQVWHYCDLNGGQASFLCPNGTIFSQVALTCDWWYNVKCSSTAQLYVLNERLYKYILPFAPKFPEDYTGPLVDKYLALKFMEMEEKMKKERKGKEENPEKTTVSSDDNIEVTTIGNTSQPT